jgi:branched-chain amino acid transport system substrate-binding protein
MAIDEWNAKGGVLGKKITPIVEDSACTPDGGTNAANKVINQDKVHYIIGEVCSKATIAIAQIANAKGVLEISPTSTNSAVTVGSDGKTKDFIFRACFIDPFQGKVAANFAFNTLKFKTAFVMVDQGNDYVKGLAEAFTDSFTKLGGKVVGTESYNGSTDKDFSAILAKVADAKPDLIYLPDYYQVVSLATKQAKEKGITAPFMGGDGWDSSDLDLKSADGGYYTNHYSPDSTDATVVNFVKAYGAKYKDDKGNAKVPDALGALAYDATNIMIQSIANAGADDATKAKDAMAAIKFQGVSGNITYDAQHNPVKSAVILQVKDGKVVFNSVVNP